MEEQLKRIADALWTIAGLLRGPQARRPIYEDNTSLIGTLFEVQPTEKVSNTEEAENARRMWKEVMMLERMFNEGRSDSYIAKKLGRSVHAIEQKRSRLGLLRRRKA